MRKITLILFIIIIFSSISFAQTDIPVRSIKQLETECSNNDFLACYFAGQLFQDSGLILSAVTAYKKACGNKIYEACVKLGILYKGDYNKTMQKEAVKLFNTACENNIASGCFELAAIYYQGEIIRKSLKKAKKLYEKAWFEQKKINILKEQLEKAENGTETDRRRFIDELEPLLSKKIK